MSSKKRFKNYELTVENGYVISAYGQKNDGNLGLLYPYKWSKKYNSWCNVSGEVAYNTLRQKFEKGYILF